MNEESRLILTSQGDGERGSSAATSPSASDKNLLTRRRIIELAAVIVFLCFLPLLLSTQGNDEENGDGNDKLESPLFRSVPDCVANGLAHEQPAEYEKTPGGGSNCQGSGGGFVYSWQLINDTTSSGKERAKIGCTNPNNPPPETCKSRIKNQIDGKENLGKVKYVCVDVGKEYQYHRHIVGGSVQKKSGSDAAEYILLDSFYCKGKWLQYSKDGKPSFVKNGFTEWFETNNGDVIDEMIKWEIVSAKPHIQMGVN